MEEFDIQLRPDDMAAIVATFGPIYRESCALDNMMFADKCQQMTYDSNTIKNELEKLDQISRRPNTHQGHPQYQQPYPQQLSHGANPNVDTTYQHAYQPQAEINPNQMEFNFNVSEQEKTNTLLDSINRKLGILISLLEKRVSTDIPRLNVTATDSKKVRNSELS